MEKLTESQEDYLEEIYLQVLRNGCAKVTDISKNLNVKKASVSGALNTLQKRGLINYAPYAPITLTLSGEHQAQKILLRHNTMTKFFVDVLGLSQEESVENACRIEHAMSEKLFDKAIKLYNIIKDYAQKDESFKNALDSLKN